jgi:hypothetical protein
MTDLSNKTISPSFLRFCRRMPDDDHLQSKHVVFENNNKNVLDRIICTYVNDD